ncbi:PREDICTED: uncharacterized protein LOC107193272 [Dufourea novaeangliae]|uniref:Uncharacterized protein n=1 Tax=Dufourea novaeangliae TaxID=178035 RepID=A0A154NZ58_DUFNO|nr:PREDICTED: uncharacterized protein LOC107193272 [Dufourea novaeangliae]KZC04903.1 hypothetical protein WN55_09702 [Dufourea novaeangliae]
MLPTSRLLREEPLVSSTEANVPRDPASSQIAVPSIVVEGVEDNDDDPPPYTAIAPPNHVGWPYDFSGIPYSTRTPPSLAPFQTIPTTATGHHLEGQDGQHTSISVPLMPCRLFKFGSHRSLFAHRGLPFTDNISTCKDNHGRTRRYGAILVAAAVILFLMALSLLVRFVMEKSFWRG